MTAKKGYLLVEGHGEVEAAQNLVVRVSQTVGLYLPWSKPLRWPNLHQWQGRRTGGIKAGAELIRSKPDAGALLILRDEDDRCPKQLAPEMAQQLRTLNLPFPTAYVLLHREYEVLFLPCLSKMGFPAWDKDSWEAHRGIKEWLSAQLPKGRAYKPSVSQLAMTQKIDLDMLRAADVPCFGSLERGLAFLAAHLAQPGLVYPI
ncbi:hypothetical protein [Candidatus Electronema sp. JC]|uniref:hypothetical protein n=1 Tax=Candidatus Electronema sp. JC TaxID=3401570 RepID=UPI003AA88A41